MHVTSMTIAVTTSSRVPIKLPTMMAMSMLLSSDSAAVVSVVVPSGEKQDYNVSFFVAHSHSHIFIGIQPHYNSTLTAYIHLDS